MGIIMQSVNSNFWKGKRVFITGHTGFKGSWLSLWLQSMGAKLNGLALAPPTAPALFEQANVYDDMNSTIGDIRDYKIVYDTMKACKPEIIIHMSAQPLVRYSYQAPVETYAVNVMGTVHLLEAARQIGTAKAIINVTTDKCYENQEWVWGYRENEPMGGHDPYSNSKGCSELISNAYRRSFFQQSGIALATVRAGNVIGGGDWAIDRLIPDILRAFEKSKPIIIRNPHAIRPWQHILEPLSGYLMLAEHLYNEGESFAEGWNFGPNDEDVRSVKWITDYMVKTWGNRASWVLDNKENPHEANYLKLDISKAKSKLKWQPLLKLEEALTLITDWHYHWLNKGDVKSKCLKQIKNFQELTNKEN